MEEVAGKPHEDVASWDARSPDGDLCVDQQSTYGKASSQEALISPAVTDEPVAQRFNAWDTRSGDVPTQRYTMDGGNDRADTRFLESTDAEAAAKKPGTVNGDRSPSPAQGHTFPVHEPADRSSAESANTMPTWFTEEIKRAFWNKNAFPKEGEHGAQSGDVGSRRLKPSLRHKSKQCSIGPTINVKGVNIDDDRPTNETRPSTARYGKLPFGTALAVADVSAYMSAVEVGDDLRSRHRAMQLQSPEIAPLKDPCRNVEYALLSRPSARRMYPDSVALTPPGTPAYFANDSEVVEVFDHPSLSALSDGWGILREKAKKGFRLSGNSRNRQSLFSPGDLLTFAPRRSRSDHQEQSDTQIRPSEAASRWQAAGSKTRALNSLFRLTGQTRTDRLKGARIEGLLFPMFPSFLAVPAYAFQTDSKGRKAPPILLEALKLAVTDSATDKSRFRFRIELEYGDVRWVIHRTMYEFVRLHSLLSLKHFQGLLPPIPHLPSAISYAMDRVKAYPGSPEGLEGRRGRMALERRIGLENYLLKLLKVLNLKVCYEPLAFLELSALSLQPNMGYKGKEGLLQHKIGVRILSSCIGLQRRRWKPRWVMLRDSFIAIGRDIAARHPDRVFLCDRFFIVASIHQHHNPIRRHLITVSNRTEQLEFACDSERHMLEWKEHFTKLKESIWSKEQRWGSFAPIRDDSFVRWFVDGYDYFWAVSEALLSAKRTIYIEDWWLSPELYLRRPPALNREYRLDRILRKKAQEGVQVRIFVYKEVTYALPICSKYTKLALHRGIYPNIIVQRHPDHLPGGTMFWAHHEKMVIVDQDVAFVGGLDLCYGRCDDNTHRLADHGAPVQETWPGQDYSNPRIRDFKDVHHFDMELIDRRVLPRMPWHDVHLGMVGQAARDVARHFIQRWNFVGKCQLLLPLSDYTGKNLSAAAETLLRPAKRYFASGPAVVGPCELPLADASHVLDEERLVDSPQLLPLLRSTVEDREGSTSSAPCQIVIDVESPRGSPGTSTCKSTRGASAPIHPSLNGVSIPLTDTADQSTFTPPSTTTSTCRVQVLRQSAEWSSGIDKEASVYTAWCELISNAKHFVYIENQFFITSTGETPTGIKNMIGKAIAERIRRAHKENAKFRVIIVMPLLPAFEAALGESAASTVRLIIRLQYESICRGPNSLYETLRKSGINAADFVEFFSLRRWDTINAGQVQSTDDGELRQTEVSSIHNAQDTNKQPPQPDEIPPTATRLSARIRPPRTTSHMRELEANDENDEIRTQMDDKHDSDSDESDESDSQKGKRNYLTYVRVRKGRAASAAREAEMETRKLAAREVHSEDATERAHPSLDIAEPALLQEGCSVVTEQIYVHSKLLIVDDRYVICGSANLNDRSMCGNRDSELALCVEDKDMVDSKMAGDDFKVGRFAHTLRVHLFKEHLGLLDCQSSHNSDGDMGAKLAAILDPLDPEFYERIWKRQAHFNTEKFREVFRCVPDDTVTTWEEYRKFLPDPKLIMTGHTVLRDESVAAIQQRLKDVRGHLVEFPLNFMKNDALEASVLSKESIAPIEIFT